ncbi:hypothetical protein GSI_03406 [Ganoderma sinense ZZ0214-1]|uniref:Uncharacterized protein n=1 Tax=Ganoderma sinense ZZ0214-1 TaxID=1077348 RepID=A0A2G8SLH9_9APHY|nr:hypothetical protein GSI_03406 [Ganoderma sinense ZZ0214-1]
MTRGTSKAAVASYATSTHPTSNSTKGQVLCLVNGLRDDILAKIFAYVRFDSEWDDSWYQVLLHVCQRWTAVARAAPILWTTLTIREEPKIELISMSLQLSGTLPLDVSLIQTKELSAALALISPHAPRLRHLSVTEVRATRDQALAAFLNQPMPNLQELELQFIPKTEPLPYFELEDARPPEDLDPFLWNPEINQCPHLRSLSLGRGVEIVGQLPVYYALRKLELHDRRSHTPFTTVTFVEFLSQHPHLEELSLRQYRPAIVPVPTPLSLPQTVRKFSLEDNAHYVKPFLSSFYIAPTVDLHLTRALDFMDHGDIAMDDFNNEAAHTVTQLLPDDRTLLPLLALVDRVTLSREFESRYALTARAPGPGGAVVELVGRVHDGAEAELREGLHVLEDVTSVFAAAPLVEIRVEGHGSSVLEKRHWARALRTFARLERVAVVDTAANTRWDARATLLEALRMGEQPPKKDKNKSKNKNKGEPGAALTVAADGPPPPPALAPQLRSLSFVSSEWDREDESFSKELERCLQSRKSRGCQLEVLHLVLQYAWPMWKEGNNEKENRRRMEMYVTRLRHLVGHLHIEFSNFADPAGWD